VVGGWLAWLLLAGPGAHAQSAPTCTAAYAQAEEAYFAAEFERAARALQECLREQPPSDSTRLRVYRLLSFAHLANNDRAAARRAVESLLDIRPTYAPDPSRDRPDFVTLVRTAKRARQPPDPTTKAQDRDWVQWVIGGVAVAAVTTVAILLLGGGDGDGEDD
jgi:hypothetical protein